MTRAFAILMELFYGFIGRTQHSFTNCEWDNELPVPCNATQLCTLHSTNVMISGSRAEEKDAKQSEPGTLFEDACIMCREGIESRPEGSLIAQDI